jgi:tungstate transport system ATP-binding protein
MPEAGAVSRIAEASRLREAADTVLPVRGEGLVFERGGRRLIDGIDIEIAGTGVLVLVGPNGSGKSLLVRLLAGLIEPSGGRVTWAGHPPDRRRAARIGMVFQRPVLLRRSALANVEYFLAVTGVPRGQRSSRAHTALARTRLEHVAQSPARVLSGGEQQRLSIARVLALDPQLLILDEPTANLDPAATAEIEHVITAVKAAGTRVVLITHHLGQAARLADEVAFLHRGRILERAPADAFLAGPKNSAAQAFVRGEIVL